MISVSSHSSPLVRSCRRGVTKAAVVGTSLALAGAAFLVPALIMSGDGSPVTNPGAALVLTTDGQVLNAKTGEVVEFRTPEARAAAVAEIQGDPFVTGTAEGEGGHTHDHSAHCGVGAVPGVLGGVILEELRINTDQALIVGGTPHEFLVDTANYSPDVEGSNYNGPAVFTISGGETPSGLTLSEDGTWSGNASVVGHYEFTVEVTNDAVSFPIEYTMDVITENLAGPAVWGGASTNNSQSIAQGALPVPFEGSGPGELYYGTMDEVPGLFLTQDGSWELDPEVAMVPGVYDVEVFLSTMYNCVGVAKTLTLTVEAAETFEFSDAPTNTSQSVTTLPGASLVPLVLVGSTEGLEVTLKEGTLPKGVSLGADGSLNGTPTSTGTFTVTVEATNALSQVASVTITITVTEGVLHVVKFTGAPTNTSQSVLVGDQLSALKAADSAKGKLTFSVVTGTLPDGVSLRPDGSFSGRTTTEGRWSVSIMASFDENSRAATELVVDVSTKPAVDPGPGITPTPTPPAPAPLTPDEGVTPVGEKPATMPPVTAPPALTPEEVEESNRRAREAAGVEGDVPSDEESTPASPAPGAGTDVDAPGLPGSEWEGINDLETPAPQAAPGETSPDLTEVSNSDSSTVVLILGLVGAALLVLLGAGGWLWKARRES